MKKYITRFMYGVIISSTLMCAIPAEASWGGLGRAVLRGVLEGLTSSSPHRQPSETTETMDYKIPTNGRYQYFTNAECWQPIPGLVGKDIDVSSIYVTDDVGKKVIYYWSRELNKDGDGYNFTSCRIVPADGKGLELGHISYSWKRYNGDDFFYIRNKLWKLYSNEEIQAVARYVEVNGIVGVPDSDGELNLESSPEERSLYLHYLPPHRYIPVIAASMECACFRDITTTHYYYSNGIKMESSDYRIFHSSRLNTIDGKTIYGPIIIANIERPVYANNVKVKKIKYCFDNEGNSIEINSIKDFQIEEISKALGNDYLNIKHGL